MKMFKGFVTLTAAFVLFMSLSIGVVATVEASKENQAISEVVIALPQHQVVEASTDVVVEESLKICKDENGQAKACEDKDLLGFLLASMGGLKGASALVIAFVISKLLLLLLLSPLFSNVFPSLEKGGWKLFIAVSLNLVVGILALMVPPTSLSFGAAITHSSVLALASVFSNQAYKQFFTAKGKA